MTIALLNNICSKYSVLNHMEDEFSKALKRSGIECCSFPLDKEGLQDLYSYALQNAIQCTLSFNAIAPKEPFFTIFGLPHLCISVDAPFWYDKECLLSPHFVPFFPDVEATLYYDMLCNKKSFCFPHACSLRHSLEFVDRKKDIPFFFPGSYLDDEREYGNWVDIVGGTQASFIASEVECFLEKPKDYFILLESLYEKVRPYLSSAILKQVFFQSVDKYIRGKDRGRLFEAVQNERVHIATDDVSFRRYQKRFPKVHFVYEGEVSFENLFPLFARSQCVLNSLPTLRKGLHERVLYALSFGCSLYSSTLESLPSWLHECGIASFYDKKEPFPHLPSVSELQRIRQWIECEHSWDARVRGVMNDCWPYVEKIRNNARDSDPFLKLVQ